MRMYVLIASQHGSMHLTRCVCQSSINSQSFTDSKVIRHPSVSLVILSVPHTEMLNAEFKWKIWNIPVGICWNYFDGIFISSIIFIYAKSWKFVTHNMQSELPFFIFQEAKAWVGHILELLLNVLGCISSPSSDLFKTLTCHKFCMISAGIGQRKIIFH